MHRDNDKNAASEQGKPRSRLEGEDSVPAGEARFAAQRLAFGPLVFHAVLALRDLGILEQLMSAGDVGSRTEDLSAKLDLSRYAVTVLLESGLGAGVVALRGDRYTLTKVGYFILHDEMTRVNLNFVRDICYSGAQDLIASLKTHRPAGLRHLGDWNTIYEGISELREPARDSWFEFDHYYSSTAFPDALPLLLSRQPRNLLDVGGNTGKFAVLAALEAPSLKITVVDDGPQVVRALQRAAARGVAAQVSGHVADLLDHTQPLPSEYDAVWMSQLLSCFSETDVTRLLERAGAALSRDGSLYILETFWDQQRHAGAAFSLVQSSVYFASVANATSRIYDSATIRRCISDAGLNVVDETTGLGISHSLLRCVKR